MIADSHFFAFALAIELTTVQHVKPDVMLTSVKVGQSGPKPVAGFFDFSLFHHIIQNKNDRAKGP
jgi:hypothetical protein